MYGWMLHIFDRPLTGTCTLVCRGGACCCCMTCLPAVRTKEAVPPVGDNIFNANYAAYIAQFRQRMAAGTTELLQYSYVNRLYQSPYVVCLDHSARALVVAVRGTLSLVDAVTDITVKDASWEGIPDILPGPVYFHLGMYKNALKIQAELTASGVIEREIGHNGRHPGYRLVFTGHSLGAGVSSVLSCLYKAAFPETVCFAFSPPAAVIDSSSAIASSSFITSCVLGNDLVPRASEYAVRVLRQEMLDAFLRTRVSKAAIMLRYLTPILHLAKSSKFFYGPDEEGPVGVFLKVEAYRKYIAKMDEARPARTMLVPGRVVQLVPVSETENCMGSCVDRKYRAIWIRNEELSRIVVLPRMFRDHLPTNVGQVLREVQQQATYVRNTLPPSQETMLGSDSRV
eukprot:comp22000_c0_seq2/m.50496 comp22000_c0_seq2/g.50496  ORF comp22000_c0_seq2/g.50496 comp22000_c0_seq2/m.50496 type:complete len:399 (-) comp22000_c0_seq2:68-1264(-)